MKNALKKIVAEQLGAKAEDVTNSASFVDDLGADSLDTVELVMALEEEFETEIPDEKAEKKSPLFKKQSTTSTPTRSNVNGFFVTVKAARLFYECAAFFCTAHFALTRGCRHVA